MSRGSPAKKGRSGEGYREAGTADGAAAESPLRLHSQAPEFDGVAPALDHQGAAAGTAGIGALAGDIADVHIAEGCARDRGELAESPGIRGGSAVLPRRPVCG